MPIYAHHGVGHIWLIDPVAHDYGRPSDSNLVGWSLLASFSENDKVLVEPFQN